MLLERDKWWRIWIDRENQVGQKRGDNGNEKLSRVEDVLIWLSKMVPTLRGSCVDTG